MEADPEARVSSFYAGQRHNFGLLSRLVRQLLGERREIRLSEVAAALERSAR